MIFVLEGETWKAVGGQRNATINEETDTIETTAKDSPSLAKEYEYGPSGWSISCDGVYVPDDAAYQALKTAQRARAKVKVRIKEGTAYTEEGDALITSRSFQAPYAADATYSLELLGTGPLAAVVAGP